MADGDYRVTYKTREVDRDDARYDIARRRVPGALDPYLYPEDRDELKRNVALARTRVSRGDIDDRDPRDFEATLRRETTRDDVSNGAGRAAATKTTYAVTSAGLEKESEVTLRTAAKGRERERQKEATVVAAPAPSLGVARRTEYRERDEFEVDIERERTTTTIPVRSATRGPIRPYDDRDREYSRTDYAYEIERPRKENGVYIIDARDADVYVGGGRESGRGFAGYRNDVYEEEYRGGQSRAELPRETDYRKSEVVYLDRNDFRSSGPSPYSGDPYMSGARSERAPNAARSQTAVNPPSRSSTRVYEDDRATTTVVKGPSRQSTRRDEEDFAFVEKRETRAPAIRGTFRDPFPDASEDPRGRTTRASMASMSPSEDEYVMVSPPQQRPATAATGRASSAGDHLRSSLVRGDKYSTEEREQRRRDRSIAFRAHEADDHYAGDHYHQPPGAEAAECGRYLKSYGGGGGRDRDDVAYSSRSSRRDDKELEYRSRSNKVEERDYDRREKDSVRYAPQSGRSRSRKRKEDDEESYVSRNYEKTTKTTYY